MRVASSRACWITPAFAGSTLAQLGDHGVNGDHPRVRGEHQVPTTVDGWQLGSPPRSRGAQTVASQITFV